MLKKGKSVLKSITLFGWQHGDLILLSDLAIRPARVPRLTEDGGFKWNLLISLNDGTPWTSPTLADFSRPSDGDLKEEEAFYFAPLIKARQDGCNS